MSAPIDPERLRHVPGLLMLEDFLSDADHGRLIEFAVRCVDESVPSTVLPPTESEGRADHTFRRSRTVFDLVEIWPLFDRALDEILPAVRKEIGVSWFRRGEVERQLSIHGEGDFFSLHADSSGEAVRRRMVTFVYYFSVRPKSYEGGELVLYEGVEKDGLLHSGPLHTVLEPTDNSIVFFPSWAFHEVRTVRSSLPEPEGLRFTVNGWFNAAAPA
jgi:SM-20-related protein